MGFCKKISGKLAILSLKQQLKNNSVYQSKTDSNEILCRTIENCITFMTVLKYISLYFKESD